MYTSGRKTEVAAALRLASSLPFNAKSQNYTVFLFCVFENCVVSVFRCNGIKLAWNTHLYISNPSYIENVCGYGESETAIAVLFQI